MSSRSQDLAVCHLNSKREHSCTFAYKFYFEKNLVAMHENDFLECMSSQSDPFNTLLKRKSIFSERNI